MKIFGIGLSRTGTTSLSKAFALLGYDLIHYPSEEQLHDLGPAIGACDLPVARFYKDLDKRYPGSKFIYTVREKESWLKSIKRHMDAKPYATLNEWGKKNRDAVYEWTYFDRNNYLKNYDEHDKDIREYFDGREEDLLEIDICSGEGWEKMLPFLEKMGLPLPSNIEDIPFPHSNKGVARTHFVDVVCPYFPQPNEWGVLKYSIRALEKNFVDLGNIWIVGDKPDWANEKLKVIPKEPEHRGTYPRNRDYLSRVRAAALHPEVSDPFLYMADDHYFLGIRSAESLVKPFYIYEDLNEVEHLRTEVELTAWQKALWWTYDRMKEEGWHGWNFETHTPKLIEKQKLLRTLSFFGYQHGLLIWQTAYGNMWCSGGASIIKDTDIRAGFYKPTPKEEMEDVVRKAVFLSHNEEGLTDDLKDIIRDLFPEPSSYEK